MPNKNRALPNELLDKMIKLREEVYADGMSIFNRWKPGIEREDFHGGAKNLAYYIALRQRDLRELQEELSSWGLSSLGRLESRTMSTIHAVISTLARITNRDDDKFDYPVEEHLSIGKAKLQENAEKLFGTIETKRKTAIMVTVGNEAADNYKYIKELVESGMNLIRMNCAHDDPEIWSDIIKNVRKAEKETGKSCRVAVDIAGPKARTNWILSSVRKDRVTVGNNFFLSKKMDAAVTNDAEIKMGCSLPEILNDVREGDRVLYDDGILEGEVSEVREDGVMVLVTKTHDPKGVRFKVDKGLNFPTSELNLSNITEQDEAALDFAVGNVDIINFSFIKNVTDMKRCIDAVNKRYKKGKKPAVVAKIETLQGIDNLPDIIAEGAGKSEFGVMVARGDLAVETGYLRLAELQQQILWICEAADVPVIWATQVLDQMVSTGIPSRAEVTDAAEGAARAECVMLNRGGYLVETVQFLDELLVRMERNVYKKSPRLRALNIAKKVELDEANKE